MQPRLRINGLDTETGSKELGLQTLIYTLMCYSD